MIKLNYDYIALCYSESGDFKNAFYYKNQSSMINDSIYSEESLRQIADMQIKYETEKKEKEIELLTRDMQVKNLKLTRNKILIAFISTGFILVLIIASVLYNRFRLKKRANVLLLHQKNEIEQQKKAITDSINYARRIQQAVMPNISNLSGFETLSGLNLESFILFKPRDVVSGDFYWISVKKSRLVVAAADCTGHGVPGAFMSMLGIAFLNEIVTNTDNLIASHILDKLRECVVKALHQSGKIGEAKDGMDMTLCIIAPAEKKLQFAGAYNPLYLIPHPLTPPLERQHTHPSPSREGEKGGVLLEIKADRMPIGISLKAEKPFTNNELSYNTGDTIYLFTDGFADQFGGKYGKKFTYHSFKKLLSDIYQNDMAEQHKILNATFEQWKAGLDQIDDVLIIGIRL
ncbi:MAG: SpoIIE family protein phosphatase [Bacteroidia bacterium]|nr:SpoIIE family protein phosphatase [Bacteroidia bacterium]